MSEIKKFTDLHAWQEAHSFVLNIYQVTNKLPKEEKYGIVSQVRRAAISITCNISEGFCRYYFKDKMMFYRHARASASEVLNCIYLIRDLGYVEALECENLINQNESVIRLVNGLIRSLQIHIK